MKHRTLLTLLISLLVATMLLPSIGQAQSPCDRFEGDIAEYIVMPTEIKYVRMTNIQELSYLMSWVKSAEVLSYLDALDEVLSPLVEDMRSYLGEDMPQIVNVAQMRSEYVAKIEALRQAVVTNSPDKFCEEIVMVSGMVAALVLAGNALDPQMRELETQLRQVETKLRSQADVLEAQIRAQIEAEVAVKKAHVEEELNQLGQAKGEAAEASVRAQVEAAAPQYADMECDGACQADLQRQLNEHIAMLTEQITAEMNALGEQKRAEITDWANTRAEELKVEVSQKFLGIEEKFENIGSLIEPVAAERRSYYEDTYYPKFLEKKRQVIREAMEPQLEAAIEQMKTYEEDINLARKDGRPIPALDDLIAESRAGADDLARTIAESETVEEVDEAIAGFEAFWADKQAKLELAHDRSSAELIDMVNQKMAEHNTEQLIAENKPKIEQNIAALESVQAKGELSSNNLEVLRRSRVILRLVNEAEVLINEFKSATPADDIGDLVELKNRLKTKLEELQLAVEDFGFVPVPGDGIFIEAENESFTELLPNTASWHSHEELNNPPWRPPLSGGGLWYFSREGEVLGYRFTVDKPGDYIIWLRDIASLDWKPGARGINIFMDGVDLGRFSEHSNRTKYPPGTFAWHTTATVTLTSGQHTLEIKKMDTTGAGPLIDAIYMTTDPKDIPSEVGR